MAAPGEPGRPDDPVAGLAETSGYPDSALRITLADIADNETMAEGPLADYSDFVVYADESGDHGLAAIDPQYPVFALVFCVLRKADYASPAVPAILDFKFGLWGNDAVVLHEHDVRKSKGPFAILMTDRDLRERFHEDLNRLMEAMPMTIFAAVIDKIGLRAGSAVPGNPYLPATVH